MEVTLLLRLRAAEDVELCGWLEVLPVFWFRSAFQSVPDGAFPF